MPSSSIAEQMNANARLTYEEEKETFSSRKQTGSARQTHSKAYPIRLALRYIFLQALRERACPNVSVVSER